jgi:hypothetical protein
MSKRYLPRPDETVLDPDRGPSTSSRKQAKLIPVKEHKDRSRTRAGARELDEAVEAAPGLSRQRRDRERAMPRDLSSEPPHPVMERRLPEPDAIRTPLSSRQRKARSVTKRAAQDRLAQTEYAAVAHAITDQDRWTRVNNALSDAMGDAQELDDGTRTEVQRLDRAIQKYEREGNRGHVVYANVEMPQAINYTSVATFVSSRLGPGEEVALDRYTGSAHTLHEIEPDNDRAGRVVAFEIQTRRGMYLGHSDGVDDTTHLLPRGLQLRVVGSHHARYRRPDGTIGTRYVVQLTDNDPTN